LIPSQRSQIVHPAELLDAEIAVCDALTPALRPPRRQRQQRLAYDAVVEPRRIGQRRFDRREQAAVERRDP
jgi:hypothetical protein